MPNIKIKLFDATIEIGFGSKSGQNRHLPRTYEDIPGEPDKSLHFFKPSVTVNDRDYGNYLFMQSSYGQNLAIRLVEAIPGHVSSELALPETNSDQAH